MKASNILAIILGVIVIIGGIYCIMTPAATYVSLSWLLGAVMVADGIANIATWIQMRRDGHSSIWPLIGAIVSIILGIVILGSFVVQLAIATFMIYLIAIWLIASGVSRMMFGWNMRALHKSYSTQLLGKHWWAPFILGILLVVLGVLSLFDPSGLMAGIGVFIGLSIIVMGISVVTLAV